MVMMAVSELQLLNTFSLPFGITNLSLICILFNFEVPFNIPSIPSVTLPFSSTNLVISVVSKLLKSNVSSVLEYSNKLLIFVTFDVSKPLKSKLSKLVRLNIDFIFFKFGVLKLLKSICLTFVNWNIQYILSTFDVSNEDTFIVFAPQLLNIKSIFFTLLVSKLLRSNDSKLEQFPNIQAIFVTLLVSKLLKSNAFNFPQPENIYDMFLTKFVFKLLMFRFSRFLQPPNISFMSVTFEVSKDVKSSSISE